MTKTRGRLVRRITACGARHPIEQVDNYEHIEALLMPRPDPTWTYPCPSPPPCKSMAVHRRHFCFQGEFEYTHDGYPIYILREQL